MPRQIFNVGDKLIYDCPSSQDHNSKGEVTWTSELGYEVTWDDGTKIDYKWSAHPGSSIRLAHGLRK
jgi:hypothetical protein